MIVVSQRYLSAYNRTETLAMATYALESFTFGIGDDPKGKLIVSLPKQNIFSIFRAIRQEMTFLESFFRAHHILRSYNKNKDHTLGLTYEITSRLFMVLISDKCRDWKSQCSDADAFDKTLRYTIYHEVAHYYIMSLGIVGERSWDEAIATAMSDILFYSDIPIAEFRSWLCGERLSIWKDTEDDYKKIFKRYRFLMRIQKRDGDAWKRVRKALHSLKKRSGPEKGISTFN